jgi:PEP-CTERM motif
MTKKTHYALVTLGALMLLSPLASAQAAVIDTTGSDNGTMSSFGDPGTKTFGQTFTVSGADTFLDSYSLFLRNRIAGDGTLDLRGYIASWDGAKAISILFASGTQTMNADGTLQEFAFDPDITLISGNAYVAFLSILDLPDQETNQFGMPVGDDTIPGSFVFTGNDNFSELTSNNWFVAEELGNGTDFWFKAALTGGPTGCNLRTGCVEPGAVPEPLTLSLLGAGLAGIGWMRRQRG